MGDIGMTALERARANDPRNPSALADAALAIAEAATRIADVLERIHPDPASAEEPWWVDRVRAAMEFLDDGDADLVLARVNARRVLHDLLGGGL